MNAFGVGEALLTARRVIADQISFLTAANGGVNLGKLNFDATAPHGIKPLSAYLLDYG